MPHLTRDGVRLGYEERGSGPAMLLIHGWCCDRSFLAEQATAFSATRRCISVDLRGHGESDVPADGYSIPGFAADVAFVARELGAAPAVVVGHSMGGAVAQALAARHPEIVAGLVMLDGAVCLQPAIAQSAPAMAEALRTPSYVQALTAMVESMFLPTDDAARHAAIVRAMFSTPQHVVAGEWDALIAYERECEADAARVTAPALYIGAEAPPADTVRLRGAMPRVTIAQTAGAGHFHQLEVPEQVNAMIGRFLRVSSI